MITYFNAREENLLWCGRPREDELLFLTKADAGKIKQTLGIPVGKKVILYMPTWREYGIKPLNKKVWETTLGNDYVILLRSHHFSKDKLTGDNDTAWIDVSTYPDVNHLYLIADYLISDYSSAFFDYGLLGKPMICFAYDYEQYEQSNGLLMNLKSEFPSGIKRT